MPDTKRLVTATVQETITVRKQVTFELPAANDDDEDFDDDEDLNRITDAARDEAQTDPPIPTGSSWEAVYSEGIEVSIDSIHVVPDLPEVLPTIYARREPTADTEFPGKAFDTVFYRNKELTEFYCRIPLGQTQPTGDKITLNCSQWRIEWQPDKQ